MFDLFDVGWNELDLQHVREFLADADEEGVTWEAKAEDERGRLRPDSIRKAACGLANQIGGYLFLGARHDQR
jgi:predicted HTH transcriptional regulator